MPALFNTSFIAIEPNSCALKGAKPPLKLPIGVRHAATKYTSLILSPHKIFFKLTRKNHHIQPNLQR